MHIQIPYLDGHWSTCPSVIASSHYSKATRPQDIAKVVMFQELIGAAYSESKAKHFSISTPKVLVLDKLCTEAQ